MDYSKYSIEDFIEDPAFTRWVLRPDRQLDVFWENWLYEHPEKLKTIHEAREIVLAFQYKKHTRDENRKERTWTQIERTIKEDDNNAGTPLEIPSVHSQQDRPVRPLAHPHWKIVGRLAAVFTGILLASLLLIEKLDNKDTDRSEVPPRMVHEHIPEGQKARLFLPDGSVVHVNGGTTVSYPYNFSATKREVILSGEAFFEVSRDSLRPFIVITGDLITTALGTSFNCKAYPDSKEVVIALLTGRVSVEKQNAGDSTLFLAPGEAAGLNENGILVPKEFDYDRDFLWRKGILSFSETQLKDVFNRLEKWYGVSFKIEKFPRKPVRVTGKFDNEDLNSVLLSLSYTSHFTYSIEQDDQVVISFK